MRLELAQAQGTSGTRDYVAGFWGLDSSARAENPLVKCTQTRGPAQGKHDPARWSRIIGRTGEPQPPPFSPWVG